MSLASRDPTDGATNDRTDDGATDDGRTGDVVGWCDYCQTTITDRQRVTFGVHWWCDLDRHGLTGEVSG